MISKVDIGRVLRTAGQALDRATTGPATCASIDVSAQSAVPIQVAKASMAARRTEHQALGVELSPDRARPERLQVKIVGIALQSAAPARACLRTRSSRGMNE